MINVWGQRPDQAEWPEHKDALLVKLWNEGWSLKAISKHTEINVTRAAVSGRRTRLKKMNPSLFTRIEPAKVLSPLKPERVTFVVPPLLVGHHAAGLCATEGCSKTRLRPYDLCQQHLAERRRPRLHAKPKL